MMAVNYPDKIDKLVLIGGPAKFIVAMNGNIIDNPKDKMILLTDKYTAPTWFKHMEKQFFDDNNFLPEIYSLNSETATSLWKQSAEVAFPVTLRYTCEYFASYVREDFDEIRCPVLVLRALFDSTVLDNPINNYLKPQFIGSWDDASKRNPLIKVTNIIDSACFIWKDKPQDTYLAINDFIFTK
jgi:pimeloyl-ACP methyl ester carboxylesterase